jgi:hypothetical protein
LDKRKLPVDNASKLKGVGFLSKYQPLSDPGVVKYSQAIRRRA